MSKEALYSMCLRRVQVQVGSKLNIFTVGVGLVDVWFRRTASGLCCEYVGLGPNVTSVCLGRV